MFRVVLVHFSLYLVTNITNKCLLEERHALLQEAQLIMVPFFLPTGKGSNKRLTRDRKETTRRRGTSWAAQCRVKRKKKAF